MEIIPHFSSSDPWIILSFVDFFSRFRVITVRRDSLPWRSFRMFGWGNMKCNTKNKKCRKNGTFFYGVICVNVEHFLLDFLSWSSVISVSVSSSIFHRPLKTHAIPIPHEPPTRQMHLAFVIVKAWNIHLVSFLLCLNWGKLRLKKSKKRNKTFCVLFQST